MIVRAAADNAEASARDFSCELLRVRDNLPCVFAESRLGRFLQAHSFGRDDMHQWPALRAGERDAVELLRELRLAQYQSAARPAQRLVRGRRNEIGVRHGTWVHPS